MKLCECYKCKRLALGMTQAEFAEIVGVSKTYVSQFENGLQLSPQIWNKIRDGFDSYCRNLDRDAYLRMRIKSAAFELDYQSEQEQLLTLGHLTIHIGKLQMDLLRANLDD